MVRLLKHEPRQVESADVFGGFDRMFEDWMRALPFRWPMLGRAFLPADVIPIDEYQDDGTLVVRADLPGIDPESDVELTVAEGALHIEAERHEEVKGKEQGFLRHEVRCGTLSRTVPLPEGVTDADITANYKDGILEIRVPAPQVEPTRKIPIAKT